MADEVQAGKERHKPEQDAVLAWLEVFEARLEQEQALDRVVEAETGRVATMPYKDVQRALREEGLEDKVAPLIMSIHARLQIHKTPALQEDAAPRSRHKWAWPTRPQTRSQPLPLVRRLRPRPAYRYAAIIALLVMTYGMLRGVSAALQPPTASLAMLDESRLALLAPVKDPSVNNRLQQHLVDAAVNLRGARRTRLGLFPYYDRASVDSALVALEQASAVLKEMDDVPQRAMQQALVLWFTAKASLMQGMVPEARRALVMLDAMPAGPLQAEARTLLQQLDARTAATLPDEAYWAERYPGGGDPKEQYALVVGIDDYPGVDNDLPSSVADAAIMKDLLMERYGFVLENIVTLRDEEATREHIRQAFTRHLGQAGPDGVAVFYYSGHGLQIEGNLAIRAPQDPEPDGKDEALYVWGRDARSSILLDDELGQLVGALSAQRILIILDACHSGTGSRGDLAALHAKEVRYEDVAAFLDMPERFWTQETAPEGQAALQAGQRQAMGELLLQPENHLLLAAAAHDEWALAGTGRWPTRGGLASVFTYFLVEALYGAPDEATFADVMNDVSLHTQRYAANNGGITQTPQLEGRAAGQQVAAFLGRR